MHYVPFKINLNISIIHNTIKIEILIRESGKPSCPQHRTTKAKQKTQNPKQQIEKENIVNV